MFGILVKKGASKTTNLPFDKLTVRRDKPLVDESVKTKLVDELSNMEFTYDLQRTARYLVVEGFEQNEESAFTYFSRDPVRRD